MNLKLIKITFASVLLYVAFAAIAEETQEKQLTLSSADVSALNIDAGAGKLQVEGKEGATQISVEAIIGSGDVSDVEYTLTLEKRGNTAILISNIDSRWYSNAYINLFVTMPSNMALDITDTSGSMQVKNIQQSLNINDGSGSMDIDNIGGDVDIEDGSGKITLANIDGDVTIKDGSGSVSIEQVRGHVSVDDGSGSIRVDTAKSFKLIDDGSGSVTLANIEDKH